MLTVYLANNAIKAVLGRPGKGRASVERMYYLALPNDCLKNGMVMNEDVFLEQMKNFWQSNHLPRKNVTLVIDSQEFVTKSLHIPRMSVKKTFEYLPREFAGVDRTKDPLFSFLVLKMDGKMQHIYATMADRDFIKKYLQLFASLDLQIESIEAANPSAVRLLQKLPALKNRTCIVELVEGIGATNFLFVAGAYQYSSRDGLFNEHGTPGFGVEMARSVSHLLQFANAQQIEEPVTDVFLGGLYPGDLEYCEESIYQMDAALTVSELTGDPLVSVARQAGYRFCDFVFPISGLFFGDKQYSFLAHIKNDPHKEAEQKNKRKLLMPVLSLFLLAALIGLGLFVANLRASAQLEEVQAFNQRADVVDACNRYDALQDELTTLASRKDAATRCAAYIASYPLPSKNVNRVLERCAVGLVEVEVTSYNAETGVLKCDTYSEEVEQINHYVELLQEEDIFSDVYYTGYSFDDTDEVWVVNVVCYLSENAGK